MKRGGSIHKGNAFERLVAARIAEKFGVPKRECFRVPRSGGHPYIQEKLDLVFSAALVKRFPASIECKHHKEWHPARFFNITKLEEGWLEQLEAGRKPGRAPVLVMRGHHTPIFAVVREKDRDGYLVDARFWRGVTALHFRWKGSRYVEMLFDDFLEVVRSKRI